MGTSQVSSIDGGRDRRGFVRTLLRDLEALERMIEGGLFEQGITRIGAEQEVFLVEASSMKPASINEALLASMGRPSWLKPELAKFNLEVNLTPRELTGSCLRDLSKETSRYLLAIRSAARRRGAEVLLTGVLPTLNRHDLDMRNLTPIPRYESLLDATKSELSDEFYRLHIQGLDELLLRHESSLLPACSNSFQVHLQVSPDEFANYYNISLLLAAPLLAIAANSPLVFGKRLWHESRMVLYQQASDTRMQQEYLRDRSPRVQFADHWLDRSVLELYREDVSRFRALLGSESSEDAARLLDQGKIPSLDALQAHNSTVYRWSRPCYGVGPNQKPHLRIENRLLPSGPTVEDEVGNAALWLGAMVGLAEGGDDVRRLIPFSDVKENFWKAAKHGLATELRWFGREPMGVCTLVLEHLVPIARRGLESRGVASEDIDAYLGVIARRAERGVNGASWLLDSFERLQGDRGRFGALAGVTHAALENQWSQAPVHAWPPPTRSPATKVESFDLQVEDVMHTRLDTVHPSDPLELAAAMMRWCDTDDLAVDDDDDRYLGLISKDDLGRHLDDLGAMERKVADIEFTEVPVVCPRDRLGDVAGQFASPRRDFIPVVSDAKLVGVLRREDLERHRPPRPDAPVSETCAPSASGLPEALRKDPVGRATPRAP